MAAQTKELFTKFIGISYIADKKKLNASANGLCISAYKSERVDSSHPYSACRAARHVATAFKFAELATLLRNRTHYVQWCV